MRLALLLLAGCVDDGLVEVLVHVWDPASGCWGPTTVEWPEEYWAPQATDQDGCTAPDRVYYFERDGLCYNISGDCPGWDQDPALMFCPSGDEFCCIDPDVICELT